MKYTGSFWINDCTFQINKRLFLPGKIQPYRLCYAFCSYWWKLAVDKAWYGEGCKKPCRREKDYTYTADQIILYEHRSFHVNGQPALWNQVQINVVYIDCHAKTIALKNATSGDPANCAANSDGEPMYFNYNYAADKGLPDDKTPAKWVDPAVYGDRL